MMSDLIADIYISISMETFEHRKYKIRGDEGINQLDTFFKHRPREDHPGKNKQ